MKILTVVGARPQFIKAANVSREFNKNENIKEVIVHTGQHHDSNMSDVFFTQMKIPTPDYSLNIAGMSHGAMTGRMLEGIEKVILDEEPDWVLVYGDTNSTLAGALAASKLHISIAHVEAGLRSFNMRMPEEQNRILTDRLSSILLCPTDAAIENLRKEGYVADHPRVINVGDVMQDSAIFYEKMAEKPVEVTKTSLQEDFALVTVHRAENTDDPARLKSIANALNKIQKEMKIILPLHPRTQKIIKKYSIKLDAEIINPVGYMQMVYMLKHCKIVLTDSGGLQKEAFFFSKPCVTLRDETEWVELIEGGFNILVGSDYKKIIDGFSVMKERTIDDKDDLYGGGNAASKIVEAILTY